MIQNNTPSNTRTRLLSVSVATLSLMHLFQTPISAGSVILTVFLLVFPVVFPPLWDYWVGVGLVDAALGALLRPWVNRWLAWLKETQAKDSNVKEPWLPVRLKEYYQRLGIMLQFQKNQLDAQARSVSAKKPSKKKRGRGRRG